MPELTVPEIIASASSPEVAIRLLDAWRLHQKKSAAIVYWFKFSRNWLLLKPELSWHDFCYHELKVSRTWADRLCKLHEANMNLPDELAPANERVSGTLDRYPTEERPAIMRGAKEIARARGAGRPPTMADVRQSAERLGIAGNYPVEPMAEFRLEAQDATPRRASITKIYLATLSEVKADAEQFKANGPVVIWQKIATL